MKIRKPYRQRAAKIFALLLCLIVIVASMYYLSTLLYPFLIGLAIAIAINPIVDFIERKSIFPRSLSVLITMFSGMIIIILTATLIVTEIISGYNYLARIIPSNTNALFTYLENYVTNKLIPLYNEAANQFNSLDSSYQQTIIDYFKTLSNDTNGAVMTVIEGTFKSIPLWLSHIPSVASVLIFSLLATFFITKDWYKLKTLADRFIPKTIEKKSIHILNNLRQALFGFMKAQLILISLTAITVLIGLLILRVEHAVTISIVIGLVDLLPYLGTGLVLIPWILYSFFSGNIGLGIGLSILYVIVIIQRQVTEPKVLSSSIGLDPLATLIALFVGYKLFGFLGLVIGPIVLVIIKAFYQAGVFEDAKKFILKT